MLSIETEGLEYDQSLLAKKAVKPTGLQQCEQHYQTTWMGKPLPNSLACECCGCKYQKQPFQLYSSPNELGYLGCGLPLYFSFVKLCSLVALLSLLVVAAPNLYFNYLGGVCEGPTAENLLSCSNTLFLKLSVFNKISLTDRLELQSYLIDANVLLLFMLFLLARRWMKNLAVEVCLAPSQADYAVLLKMPQQTYREKDVREAIEMWWITQLMNGDARRSQLLFKCKERFPVEKILISYNLKTFRELEKELQDLTQEVKFMVPTPGGSNIARRLGRIENLKGLIANKQFARNATCLVLFSYPQQQRYLLSKYGQSLIDKLSCSDEHLLYNGKEVQTRRAPMPEDVVWQNHSVNSKKKQLVRWLIRLGCFFGVLLVGGSIFGLLMLYFNFRKGTPQLDSFICPLISLSISFTNTCLWKVSAYLDGLEKQSSVVEQMSSSACKLCVMNFVNSGIMLFLAYIIFDPSSIWVYNGFIDTLSYSFLFAIILPQLYTYCSLDVLRGWHLRSKLRRNGLSHKMTQQQANQIFERPSCRIEQLYSQLIGQLWWCSLVAPIVPLGYPCILVSVLLFYWVSKINMLHVFRQPKHSNDQLNSNMMGILEVCVLLLAVGNFALDAVLFAVTSRNLSVAVIAADSIAVALGIVLIVFPKRWLDRIPWLCYGCKSERMFLNVDYEVAATSFHTTYEKHNPLYRYDVMDKQKVIEENLEVEMESLTQELQDTLKKVHKIHQRHPLRNNLNKSEESDKIMYSSLSYPEKIERKPTRKNSLLAIPSLRQYFDPSQLSRQSTFPMKPDSDRLVDFTEIVQGLDETQKGQVLSKVLSTLKQINKKH